MTNLVSLKKEVFQGHLLIAQEFLQACSLFHMIRAYSSAANFHYISTHPEFLSDIMNKASNIKS
jgi:hypothetical protein